MFVKSLSITPMYAGNYRTGLYRWLGNCCSFKSKILLYLYAMMDKNNKNILYSIFIISLLSYILTHDHENANIRSTSFVSYCAVYRILNSWKGHWEYRTAEKTRQNPRSKSRPVFSTFTVIIKIIIDINIILITNNKNNYIN
jgi:hypothetical protein